MSRLSEMIKELCPDGVEYRKLGEILSRHKGIAITAGRMKELHTPNGEIRIFAAGNTYADVMESDVDRDGIIREPAIIVKSRGNIGFEYYTKPFSHKNEMWSYTTDHAFISLKYVYYVLEQNMAYFQNKAKTGKLPQISISDTENYEIPVPPLPIQNEIVKMLDNFTELTAELTAELTLRKKQYNFYRDSLLNFVRVDDTIVQTDSQTDRQVQRISKFGLWRKTFDVEWKTLGEVSSQICSGGTPTASNAAFYVGTIPWLRTQEIDWADIYDTGIKISEEALKASSARWIPVNCVIVAMYGATAAKVAINRIPLTTNQACCNLKINEEMAEHRYVYHWLCSQYKTLKAKGQGSQSNINKSIIEKYPIPIPPLDVQQKIVSILDRFDTLTSDLTQGLPAEIAARRKQYEYCRDKLLTFRRKGA